MSSLIPRGWVGILVCLIDFILSILGWNRWNCFPVCFYWALRCGLPGIGGHVTTNSFVRHGSLLNRAEGDSDQEWLRMFVCEPYHGSADGKGAQRLLLFVGEVHGGGHGLHIPPELLAQCNRGVGVGEGDLAQQGGGLIHEDLPEAVLPDHSDRAFQNRFPSFRGLAQEQVVGLLEDDEVSELVPRSLG